MIVRSPRLVMGDYGVWLDTGRCYYFCVDDLKRHVEVPTSRGYQVEASNRQWADKSGTRVRVKMIRVGTVKYCSDFSHGWQPLLPELGRYLRKLGCKPGGPAKVVYFRLLYEE